MYTQNSYEDDEDNSDGNDNDDDSTHMNLIQIEIKMGKNLVHIHNAETGLYKLCHPAIPDGRTWSKLGEYDPGMGKHQAK